MADSKKYDGSQWEHSLRKMTTATADIEPTIYTDGTAITSYTIKGNTVQDGTPTPSAPISVNGVGDKTANLLNPEGNWTDFNCTHSVSGGNITVTGLWFSYLAFTAKPNTTYGMKYDNVLNQHVAVYKNAVSGTPLATTYTDFIKFTTDTDTQLYIVFYANIGGTERTVEYKNVRLFEGDYTSQTIPDYEPYGYKIPISSGQQTIDIYIGDLPLLKSLDGTAVDEISNGTLTRRVDSDGSVLPTPTTTQITMPSIPTTEGANTITVDTTVQPSEFTATWTGWHDASVKEWDGSEWQ